MPRERFERWPKKTTRNVMEENRIACKEAGMNDFMTKPIDLNELQAVIKKWS